MHLGLHFIKEQGGATGLKHVKQHDGQQGLVSFPFGVIYGYGAGFHQLHFL